MVASGRTKTNVGRDSTVKVDLAGLRAGTTSAIGRTQTLPSGAAPSLRMALVSCSNYASGYFNVYRRMAEPADLDLVMHLGDYIYEYGSGQTGNVRTCEPEHEIFALSDCRERHAQYERDADSQEMHRQHPLVAIWDDHETANNSWVDGVENHQPGTEGSWPARVAAALQAFYEWMPVRVVDPANLRKNNRSFALGNLVDLIMLEERVNARSKQINRNVISFGNFTQTGDYLDPTRQILGAEEESWLAGKLRGSTAKWKVVGQGVMFAQLKSAGGVVANGGGTFFNPDQWDGYQPARDRVYDIIKGNASTPAVNNVVILTGDIHSSFAADLSQDPNNGDVASGGYNADSGAGSRAVELVSTSVTSPGAIDPKGIVAAALQLANPHLKYIDLTQRGYMLLDVDATRVVSEWWYVDTVTSRSSGQAFGKAMQVSAGANHLIAGAQTAARPNPPALAP